MSLAGVDKPRFQDKKEKSARKMFELSPTNVKSIVESSLKVPSMLNMPSVVDVDEDLDAIDEKSTTLKRLDTGCP